MCKKLDVDKVKEIKSKIKVSIRTLSNIAVLAVQKPVDPDIDLSNTT